MVMGRNVQSFCLLLRRNEDTRSKIQEANKFQAIRNKVQNTVMYFDIFHFIH